MDLTWLRKKAGELWPEIGLAVLLAFVLGILGGENDVLYREESRDGVVCGTETGGRTKKRRDSRR